MAAGSDEDDAEWAGPIERDVRSVAGWDGEGEGEGTPLEDEEEEADGDQIPLTLDALYRDGDVDTERPDDAGAEDGTRGTDADDDATTCPVCFRPLRDLADTDAARLAHVNACLDDGGWRDEEDDGHPVATSPRRSRRRTRGRRRRSARRGTRAARASGTTSPRGSTPWTTGTLRQRRRALTLPRSRMRRREPLAALGHVGDGARRRACSPR